MTYKVANYPVAFSFYIRLNCMTNVANSISYCACSIPRYSAFWLLPSSDQFQVLIHPRHKTSMNQKLRPLSRHISTLIRSPSFNTFTRKSVANFVVDTTTGSIFVTFIANLSRHATMTFNKVSHKYFNIPACNARFNKRP